MPALHHGDAVAHRERLGLVVRDIDERDADVALDVLEDFLHGAAQLEVQRAQGLVQEQSGGLVHEAARQGDPLALAAGELLGQAPLVALHGNQAEHPRRCAPGRRRARRRASSGETRCSCAPSCGETGHSPGTPCARSGDREGCGSRRGLPGGPGPRSALPARRSSAGWWSSRSPRVRGGRRTRPWRICTSKPWTATTSPQAFFTPCSSIAYSSAIVLARWERIPAGARRPRGRLNGRAREGGSRRTGVPVREIPVREYPFDEYVVSPWRAGLPPLARMAKPQGGPPFERVLAHALPC